MSTASFTEAGDEMTFDPALLLRVATALTAMAARIRMRRDA